MGLMWSSARRCAISLTVTGPLAEPALSDNESCWLTSDVIETAALGRRPRAFLLVGLAAADVADSSNDLPFGGRPLRNGCDEASGLNDATGGLR